MKPFLSDRITAIYTRLADQMTTLGLLGLAFCFLAITVLGWLCHEVWKKETFRFDTDILLALHRSHNPLLDRLMLGITQLGNPAFIVGTVVVGLVLLLWRQKRLEFWVFAIASLGALIFNQGMKLLFTRPRPTLWQSLIQETSYSFPSGHALGASVVYGFLAYLLIRRYPRRSHLVSGIAITIIGLIGLSRLYLGVHYPTDILAGYIVGLLWLGICIALLRHFDLGLKRLEVVAGAECLQQPPES